MKRVLIALTAVMAALLTCAIVLPVSPPALAYAEEGEPQGLAEVLEEQDPLASISSAGQVSMASTVQTSVSSASEANKVIARETKRGNRVVINMVADLTNKTIEIPSKADVVIKMNGYTINRNCKSGGRNDCAISVGSNVRLVIEGGTRKTNKSVRIYGPGGSASPQVRNIAGLITGGYNTNGGGGIDMGGGSSVTLNNVYLAGNRAEQNWQLDGHGGGIYVGGANTNITLNNSYIIGNYAYDCGGGIYANKTLCTITLTKSDLDGNVAARGHGGGIHLDSDTSYITGDGKSSIRYNYAKKLGGGVYLNKSGLSVKSVKIDSNKAENGGGGIWADSSEATLSDLVVVNNSSGVKGGGIAITKKKTTISSCTITNNKISGKFSGYVGAGVWVPEGLTDRINLSGTCVIKDNQSNAGNFTLGINARVVAELSRGSDVHMGLSRFPYLTARITPDNGKNSNCIRYLTSDNNAHFTYNSNQNAIYMVTGAAGKNDSAATGEPARQPQSATTITPAQAAPTVVNGLSYNNREVIRGFVRFPNVEDGRVDSATSFYYSDGYFLGEPTRYNEHLATLSMCMAMSGFYLNAGGTTDYTNKHASARQFMSDIGCKDDDIYVNDFNVQKPGSFTIGVTIASKKIPATDYTLVPIAVRGAGYEAEWTSNVTMDGGAGTEHSGFAQAANKVVDEVNSYLARHNLTQKAKQGKVKFWISGYSRAGATSNLTAKRLLDQYASGANGARPCDVYAYPVEAPQGGSDDYDKQNPERYYSIHNIINKADLVPLVGPTRMGFKRYGVDHFIPGGGAGKVTKNAEIVDRTGSSTATANPVYSSHAGAPIAADRTVYTWYDNTSYATNSSSYAESRKGMLPQLEAIDPNISFNDFFETADMDFFPSPVMRWKKSKTTVTEEDFIRMFINDVQHWGIGNRTTYNNKLQRSFQDVIGTVFSMDNESMAGFANRASTCMDRIPSMSLSGKSKRNIYASAIGAWHKRNDTDKKVYVNTITTAIDATGAYDYLTPQQKTKVRSSLPTFIDFALMIVDGDYNNKSFGDTATCMMLPTFALNASRIMSNHYPEVNLAWLRAADSYYNNDKTAYVIGKASNVSTPAAKVGEKELAAGENTVLAGKQSVTLDVKDLKGEAVYYKVSKGSTRLSQDTCKNGYEIYRGPFQLNLESGNTYTITAYAMSYGTKSGEVTYTIKTKNPEHKVTILNAPNMEASKGKVVTAEEGSKVELKADQRVTQSDVNEFVFTEWTFTDEKGNKLNLLPQGTNTYNTSLKMPVGNQNGLSANYSLVAKANYITKVRTDNLHDIEIFVGADNVKTLKAREGETVTYTPTLGADKYNDHWTAYVVRGNDRDNVTDDLKPQLNGVWAGKSSSELKFVVPRHGDVLKIDGFQTTIKFQEGDKLSLDTSPKTMIKRVQITGFPDPQAETASGKYTCRHYVSEQEFLVDYTADASTVKWDKSVQTKVNRDTTTTTTTTYTTYVVTNWSSAYMYSDNVQVTTNVDNCTATVEPHQDGKVRIRLQVVKSQTTGTPKNTIYCNAYDINDESPNKTPLTKDGQTIETWRVIEGTSFVADWSPSVPGGQPTWNSYAPADSGLVAVSGENNKYQIRQGSEAKLLLNCEQKPVINNVEVKAFPAPKVGESLATKPADGAMTDAINLVFNKPADSVFTTYAPQITELTWIPSIPESGKAQGQTQYTCIIKLKCADDKQIYLDRNTTVSVAEGLGVTTSRFLLDRDANGKLKDGEGTLYLTFEATERDTDHKVAVKDNAEAGNPVTHTWQEGEIKTVAAKDDYADKVFERWTVTMTPVGGDSSALNNMQLQAMGLDAAKLEQPKLAFTVPAASADAGALFGDGYALSLTAVYHNKANELFISGQDPATSIQPAPDATDFADTATLTWHWMANETEQTGTVTTDIAWTAETVYSETTGTHSYTATMRLDAQHARQLRRGEALPQVLASVPNDLYTQGTATWNADGSLTVTVAFGPMVTPLPAYKVSIGAYDANNPTSKLRTKGENDSLVDMPDVEQAVVSEIGDEDGFTLAAPMIEGAEFVRWEIPGGSKIVPVGEQGNKFKFAEGATAEDTIAIYALYKPVVKNVVVGLAAPKAGEALATEAAAGIELQNASAFVANEPWVTAVAPTWTPAGVEGKAAYGTEYAAAMTLTYKKAQGSEDGWICGYADDVIVSCADASNGTAAWPDGTITWLDTTSPAAYVLFPQTERDDRHAVEIRDFAEDDEDEDDPKQEIWYEGETKYLVAKQYADKLFTGWTITRVAEGIEDEDVTRRVLIRDANAADAAIGITVPAATNDTTFPEGYVLVAVANYRDKVQEFNVTVPHPMGSAATVAWDAADGETTITRENQPVTWSFSSETDTSTGNKITRTDREATINVTLDDTDDPDAFVDNPEVSTQFAEGEAEEELSIDYGEISCTRTANGFVITVPLVTVEETIPARTIALNACDVNTDDHATLDGTEVEEHVTFEDDEDGVMLCAPDVDGGVFVGWEFDENAFSRTPVLDDESISIFALKPYAEVDETNVVKALYKPVVDTVSVDFAAPRAGEKLVGKDGATVAYELANDAFAQIEGTVSSLTWVPDHNTADFEQEYIAGLVCIPNEEMQYALSDNVMGAYGSDVADLVIDDDQHTVYVEFDATEPRNNHKVTVIDNAYGQPTTYLWQETSTKHVVAKPNEDKSFSHWTITDQKGADVTGRVLSNDQVDDRVIELTMPQGSGAASFPTVDYALTITANYSNKADQLSITGLAIPTADAPNTTCSWQWTDGTSTSVAPSVDVMWTRTSSDDGDTYTATMLLDASKASALCHNGLEIAVNGDANQSATATWDDDGNLTVTTTFTKAADPETDATFRTVRMKAYDANNNQPLGGSTEPLETLLYNKSYEVLVTDGTAKLVPYQVSGGVFHEFEIESGTAAESVVGTVLTFDAGSTNEAVVHVLYKPVVNSVRVNVTTPSNGQSLATTASASATLAASTVFSAPGAIARSTTWKPADDSADAAKEYEAAVALAYRKDFSSEDAWQYAYAPEAYATTSGPAYTAFNAAGSTAYLIFDENSPTQLISVMPVADLYTSYENNNADAIQTRLAAERPKANIEVANGNAIEADITWEKPTLEVDGGKLEGAIWRARGKLTMPQGVQTQDLYVTVTVYVSPSDTLDLVHVDQPADIYDLQAGADEATVRDQLPTETDLILEEGVVTTGAINWTKVECVDSVGTFRYSAKWTATGTVKEPLPDDVSNLNSVPLDVTMDIYVDLPDEIDNKAEMPYALPEDDVFDFEKDIVLVTDEPDGVVYYRIVSDITSTDYPTTEFAEFTGYPIYLENETVSETGILCIEAYTVAPNKEQSDVATFVYELNNTVAIPEGDELLFDGTEQVGVWGMDGYTLTKPSSGASIDEGGSACATNVGTYTVVAKVDKNRSWYVEWDDDADNPTTSTNDQTITFKIVPNSINNCTIELPASAPYTGSAVTPKPVIKLGDYVAVEGRDYTLTYENNVTVGKARVIITGKGNLKDSVTREFMVDGGDSLAITYAGHVQTYGDIPAVQNGATLGTVGQSKRIESFTATVTGASVEYRAHVQRQGWDEDWKRDGELCGTTGQSKRVEAIQVRLSDRQAEAGYHVWYRVHAQNYGWLGWACDGAPAGTSGQSKRLEAIEMVVLKGDAKPEGYDASKTSFNGRVSANAHVQTYGWLGYKSAGKFGTTGKSKRMEAFWLKPDGVPDCGVEYQSHVQRQGWETDWHANGDISGTMGKRRRVEAVRIRLTGEAAKNLSIWYRVHSQTFGWSGWARDGQDAGTAGYSKRVESIEVVVLSKDAAAPGSTENALRSR